MITLITLRSNLVNLCCGVLSIDKTGYDLKKLHVSVELCSN